MNAKLTLQLEKEIIEKAKSYAKNKNQSLSSLVQDYFNFLSEGKPEEDIEISRNIKEISGIIKLKKDFNMKKDKAMSKDEYIGVRTSTEIKQILLKLANQGYRSLSQQCEMIIIQWLKQKGYLKEKKAK